MSFKAKYDGRCGECGQVIEVGDLLEWQDAAVVHSDCVTDEEIRRPRRQTCPDCWTVVAANGACGCDPE